MKTAIKAALQGEGVSVYDIETVVIDSSFSSASNWASLQHVLATAFELGAVSLNVCADDDDQARLAQNFAALCQLAAQAKLRVDLECMAWRSVNTMAKAAALVEAAGNGKAAVLTDALHLAQCGGAPRDLRLIKARHLIAAQLCDTPLAMPAGMDAVITEARSGRLLPGEGELPLRELIRSLSAGTIYSVEIPSRDDEPPAIRARRIYDATCKLFLEP